MNDTTDYAALAERARVVSAAWHGWEVASFVSELADAIEALLLKQDAQERKIKVHAERGDEWLARADALSVQVARLRDALASARAVLAGCPDIFPETLAIIDAALASKEQT